MKHLTRDELRALMSVAKAHSERDDAASKAVATAAVAFL
jgi:hypothetical protein